MLKDDKHPQHSGFEVVKKYADKMRLDWGRFHLPPEGGRVSLQLTKVFGSEFCIYSRVYSE